MHAQCDSSSVKYTRSKKEKEISLRVVIFTGDGLLNLASEFCIESLI